MIQMFCTKCGFENADNARFCGNCGDAFPQQPPRQQDAASGSVVTPPPESNTQVPPVPSYQAPPAPQTPPSAAYHQPAWNNGNPQTERPVTPEMLNSQWYYLVNQLVYGPVSAASLSQLVHNRILNFDTPVKMVSQANPADIPWTPINKTMMMDIYYSGAWHQNTENDVFSSGMKAIKNTINTITGDSGKLNISFSQLFSDVFKKHSSEEADQIFISGTSLTTPPESELSSGWPKPWLFSRVFLMLMASFGILWTCCLAFGWQNSANVIPGMIFMGALAVPFSVVVFFLEINVPRNVSFFEVIKVFFIGGAFSLLLTFFLGQIVEIGKLDYWGAILVGIVEEIGKFAALLFFIRKTNTKYILNGLLIGAAVGAGFAVFETAGYALNMSQYYNQITDILFLRGVLAIGGHVAWAAVSGAAIMMVKKDQPLSSKHVFSGKFLQLFIIPVILHAIWDMPIPVPTGLQNLFPVQILLTVAIWFFLIKLVNSGLRQVEEISKRNEASQL